MSNEDQLLLGLEAARRREPQAIAEGCWLLPGFVLLHVERLLQALATIEAQAPLRHMTVPGGRSMSVATTNTGLLGWVSDTRGYRYSEVDPIRGTPWPAMPNVFAELAQKAAAAAGYDDFAPDACLINRYAVGARMGMHQDRDEQDFSQPIVSVSLGISAVFNFGGATRKERPTSVTLEHGDVVVFGGPSRLHYHGVKPLKANHHPITGPYRYNLTFRRAR